MLVDKQVDARLRAALEAAHTVMDQNLVLRRQSEIALLRVETDGYRQRERMIAGLMACQTRAGGASGDAGGKLLWFPSLPPNTALASDAVDVTYGIEHLLWFPGVCPQMTEQ